MKKPTPSIVGTMMLGACWLMPSAFGAPFVMAESAQNRLEFNFVQAGARNSGQFKDFSVRFEPPTQSENGRIEVVIETRSLDTQDGDRDSMLRSGYFFEADFYPQATFVSEDIVATGEGTYEATGQLTIRETTREIAVPFSLESVADSSGPRLRGNLTIRRLDYGVGQGDWSATTWIRNDVGIAFDVELAPEAE